MEPSKWTQQWATAGSPGYAQHANWPFFLTSTGFTRKKGDPHNDCVIHSKYFEGYEVIGTEANSEKQGGVAFAIYAPRGNGVVKPNYHLENVCWHGNNCMSCLYCTGIRKIPIIGAYLLPGQQGLDDLHTHVQNAFNQYPTNHYAPVFMGDFNVDLDTNSPNDLNRQQAVLYWISSPPMESYRVWFLTSNSAGAMRRWVILLGSKLWRMEPLGDPSVITFAAETEGSLPMLPLENLRPFPRLTTI